MKIALLQLNSRLGQVEQNILKADELLSTGPENVNLLVLPELAFTGYNFPDLTSIRPFLEPTTSGPSTQWAIRTAQRLRCHVIVGYPEISTEVDAEGKSINYNSTVTVSPEGSIVASYRKSFLYYTDESWATEGSGFYYGELGAIGTITHGICMDINPKEFTAPWTAYEFASHCMKNKPDLIVLSMAWLTHTPPEVIADNPEEPDMSTLSYWIQRFMPLIDAEDDQERWVVCSNRCGSEVNQVASIKAKNGQSIQLAEPSATYAGSSCVMRFRGGQVAIQDMLGQDEESLLVVDTEQPPRYTRRNEPRNGDKSSQADSPDLDA